MPFREMEANATGLTMQQRSASLASTATYASQTGGGSERDVADTDGHLHPVSWNTLKETAKTNFVKMLEVDGKLTPGSVLMQGRAVVATHSGPIEAGANNPDDIARMLAIRDIMRG